jgi:hypothetical protein
MRKRVSYPGTRGKILGVVRLSTKSKLAECPPEIKTRHSLKIIWTTRSKKEKFKQHLDVYAGPMIDQLEEADAVL